MLLLCTLNLRLHIVVFIHLVQLYYLLLKKCLMQSPADNPLTADPIQILIFPVFAGRYKRSEAIQHATLASDY